MPTKPNIIFEDASLMVVEKPAGLPCLPEKNGVSPTLVDLLKLHTSRLKDFGLVHRLDNDTSGLIVIAKTSGTYDNLRKQFSTEDVSKEYVTLVVGNPPERGIIDAPIAHHPRKKKKMIVSKEGRPAHTEYEKIKVYQGFSLLKVMITTGVRHQIRVHLASLGYPLLGDKLYQNPKKRVEDIFNPPHHLLHAHRLEFLHPVSHEKIASECDLPASFQELLKT